MLLFSRRKQTSCGKKENEKNFTLHLMENCAFLKFDEIEFMDERQ